MSRDEALRLAEEKGLDLVNISPSAKPPVCKLLDYGKYRYELKKKEKEARKKQTIVQIKEIRLSTFIEDHDIMVKAKTAYKFLENGDKVKVTLRFRGRERDYTDKGREVMEKLAKDYPDVQLSHMYVDNAAMQLVRAPKQFDCKAQNRTYPIKQPADAAGNQQCTDRQ